MIFSFTSTGAAVSYPEAVGVVTEWSDGLERFFVTVDASVLEPGDAHLPGSDGASDLALDLADVQTGELLSRDDLEALDPALAAALTRHGLAESAAVIDSGALLVAHLESLPGVDDALPLSPTTAEITTHLSRDDVASLAGVTDVVESMPLIAFDWEPTDDWFGAGWQLDSRGQTFDGRTYGRDTDIDAPEAWDVARGDGVLIAVVDGGFTADPTELIPNLWTNAAETCGNGVDDDMNGFVDDCHGWDFYNRVPLRNFDGTSAHFDLGRHGVGVASAAAAPAGNNGVVGVAPGAEIMMLGAGNGQQLSSGAIAAAVDYAIANGADVINFSFGSVLQPAYVDSYRNYYRPMLDAVEAADIVLVAAAGNSGQSVGSTPSSPAYFVAERPNGMAVAATDASDSLAYYTQWGDWVSLAAPGSDIALASPDGPVRYMSGTSFASPITAGAAAVLRSAYPGASATDVVTALESSADRLPQLASRIPYGRRLNVDRALDALAGADLVDVVFSNLVDMGPTARVSISADRGDRVVFTLATMIDGTVLAVPGRSVTWNGVTATTDGSGRVSIAAELRSGVDSSFHVDGLPAGAYGLIAQASAGSEPIDEPVLSVFTVGVGSAPVTTTIPSIPPTTRAGSVATTTTAASGGAGPGATTTSTPTGGGGGGSGGSGGSWGGSTTTSVATPVTTRPAGGSGGGSPTPTTPPSYGGGTTTTTTTRWQAGGGATTTTVGSTTTTPASPTSTSAPPPSNSNTSRSGIRISSVSPTAISIDGDVVVIYGTKFPAYPAVTIGGQPAQVFAVFGDQTILVQARPHAAGWADVTVSPIADQSDMARLTNALQYVDPAGSGGGRSGGGSGSGGSGGSGGGSTPTTAPGYQPATTTTVWSGTGPGATTSTTVWRGSSPTTTPASSTTSTTHPVTTSTTRVPYDTSDPNGWNVAPAVPVAPIGPEGAAITLDDWNDAYRPGGSSTGVRIG